MLESQLPSPNSAAASLELRSPPPNWNRVYRLIAGICLLTVLTSVGLMLRSAGLFSDSSEANEAWAQRLSLHARLNAILVVIVVLLGCAAGFQVIKLSRRLTVLSEDHAELLRLRQSFEEASRARTAFLTQLSHDIRTPMAGILGMTALALDTELTEEQRNYLGEVKSSAETLLDVIVDNCDFPAIDSGPLELESIEFDLHEVIATAVKPQALRAHEKGVELVCHVMPDVPAALVGDPVRLRQIVASLVSSALKFTERGEVIVQLQFDRQTEQEIWLEFAVQDTSEGIAADRRKAIAEALSGDESVSTNPEARAGLGLSIAAQLIARMRGSLTLDSVVGEGNTFRFTIGFGVPAAQNRGTGPVVAGSLQDVRVLVVDDSVTQQRVLHELLSFWKMRPTIVNSGVAALAAMKSASDRHEPFRMALIDANMPDMNGFELVREIAREPRPAPATILMIDAGNMPAEEASCRELGAVGWVTKPIMQSELLNAITMAIRMSVEFKGRTPPLAGEIPQPAAARLHILLIEDNAVNQKVASHILQKRGHQVEIASSGEKGLAAWELQTFDLILMDVQMPGMDGFQATSHIRQKESGTGQHVPIVALTAHALPGDREKCLAAGMDGYVSKPIQTSELFAAIDAVRRDGGRAAIAEEHSMRKLEAPASHLSDDADRRLVFRGNSSVNVAP